MTPKASKHAKPALSDCHIYHSIDLPGESLQGDWDLRPVIDDYLGGLDFQGKSVTDIGAATGFLSFEAEKRGASSVISVDAPQNARIDLIPWIENETENLQPRVKENLHRVKNGYFYCWHALQSKATTISKNIYNLEIPPSDIVLAGCILLHLQNPWAAITQLVRVCQETLVICDMDQVENTNPVLFPNFAKFQQRTPLDLFSWWALPPATISRMLDVLGWNTVEVKRMKIFSPTAQQSADFYSLVARRR